MFWFPPVKIWQFACMYVRTFACVCSQAISYIHECGCGVLMTHSPFSLVKQWIIQPKPRNFPLSQKTGWNFRNFRTRVSRWFAWNFHFFLNRKHPRRLWWLFHCKIWTLQMNSCLSDWLRNNARVNMMLWLVFKILETCLPVEFDWLKCNSYLYKNIYWLHDNVEGKYLTSIIGIRLSFTSFLFFLLFCVWGRIERRRACTLPNWARWLGQSLKVKTGIDSNVL